MSLAPRLTTTALALMALLGSLVVVAPPEAAAIVTASPADVVFVIDESGSMGGDQRAVRDNVDFIAEQVSAAVDAQFGLVGFGASSVHGTTGGRGHLHTSALTDRDGLASALGELVANGGTEPGVEATAVGLEQMGGYRAGATTCVVLITDEDADEPIEMDRARAALAQRNGVFTTVGTLSGNTSSTYGTLSDETGGIVESISAFRSDPTRVLGAVLESCADTAAVPPGSQNFGDRPWQGHWGDPISLASGNFYGTWDDLTFPDGVFGMDVARSYNSLDAAVGPMGRGWVSPFAEDALLLPSGDMVVLEPDGRRLRFEGDGDGTFTAPPTVHAELVETGGGFELRYVTGETWQLAADGQLQSRSDWTGQTITYARDAEGRVTGVTSSTGYELTLTYADGLLVSVDAADGRSVGYGYDDGALSAVTLPDGGVQTWTVDDEDRVTEIRDPDGRLVLANTYDESGRVTSQLDPAEGESQLSYDGNTTTVEDLRTGETLTYVHDDNGMLDEVVDPLGASVDYDYDAEGNLVSVTDRRGATTTQTFDDNGMLLTSADDSGDTVAFTYDAAARMTSRTDAAGSTWTMSYDQDERIPSQVVGPDGATTDVDVEDGLVEDITDADGVVDDFDYDPARNLVEATNGVGDTTTFAYDAAGHLTSVVFPSGATTELVVDEVGRISSETDAAGATTTTEFTDAGLVTEVVDPTGATTSMSYDDAGRLVGLVDGNGDTTTYTYDDASRLTSMTEPGSAETSYTYGPLGRVETVTDPEGGVTSFTHDTDGSVASTTDPVGNTTTRDFDVEGRLVAETDGEGNTTTYTYDELDRLVSVSHPDGTTEQIDHDPYGRVVELVDHLGAAESRDYTAAGRLAQIVDPVGDVTGFAYDDAGRLTSVTDGEGGTTTLAHTPDGDVAAETSATGLTTAYGYDPVGRLTEVTDPGGDTTTAAYTLRGELERLVDPTGAVTEYGYDAVGRLVESVDANGGTTSYGYDGRGNRTSRTNQAGHTETWEFDLADRLVASTDQLGNTTTASYDAAGRLVETVDPTGRVEQLAYDGRDLLVAQSYGDGTSISHGYDSLGRRTAMTDATGTTSWTYDAVGNLTAVATPDEATVGYGYDAARRRTSTTYPGGRTVTTAYDGRGLPVEVDDPDHGVTRLAYDADGRVTSEQLPDGLREFTYDAAGELDEFVQQVDGRDEVEALDWDAAGRLAERTNGRQTATYDYDPAGQLLEVAIDGGNGNGNGNGKGRGNGRGRGNGNGQGPGSLTVTEGTYRYDAVGNRTWVDEPGRRNHNATFDAAGRLETSGPGNSNQSTYSYDAAGRRVGETGPGTTVDYRYDDRGELVEIVRTKGNGNGKATTETRTVDGDGRLVATELDGHKEAKSTGYVWDHAAPVEQVLQLDRTVDAPGPRHDVDDQVDLTYVGDRRVGYVRDGGTAGSFATDPLGNAVQTAGTADLAAASVYTPYGATDEPPGHTKRDPVAGMFGFRGELSTSVGLHLRAREYDTATGTFLTVDPLDGLPAMTVESSAYHYANNDPANYVDPLGLRAVGDCSLQPSVPCFDSTEPATSHGWQFGAEFNWDDLLGPGHDFIEEYLSDPHRVGRGADFLEDLLEDGARGLPGGSWASRYGDPVEDFVRRYAGDVARWLGPVGDVIDLVDGVSRATEYSERHGAWGGTTRAAVEVGSGIIVGGGVAALCTGSTLGLGTPACAALGAGAGVLTDTVVTETNEWLWDEGGAEWLSDTASSAWTSTTSAGGRALDTAGAAVSDGWGAVTDAAAAAAWPF